MDIEECTECGDECDPDEQIDCGDYTFCSEACFQAFWAEDDEE